jgi:hypothetical protein
MRSDEIRRRSRWMMRAQEWDEPRARYPNVWHDDMPVHVLAYDTVVSRMRLGDLVAVYYPSSQRHRARSERFLGLSRVVGLRRSHDPAYAWLDLEIAHRFSPPLDLGESPRRVVLCCDPGWPEREVALFRKVWDAAVAAGWKPTPEETEEGARPRAPEPRADEAEPVSAEAGTVEPEPEEDAPAEPRPIAPDARLFGGAVYSGELRDPRDGSWLAVVELRDDRLEVIRLEATGRAGLHGLLRDPDGTLMKTEGIGLGFPFSLPGPFAEKLLGGPFPEDGWWAFARHIEKLSLPNYLIALQEFRDVEGELSRLTDEATGAPSPLRRSGPDLGARAYHGIKMIAEERSRYAIRPFEQAQGRLLLEVYPEGALQRLNGGAEEELKRDQQIDALGRLESLPVIAEGPLLRKLRSRHEALCAVLAARCAAVAVVSGEADKSPEDLGAGEADRVRREGWIYGLA